MRAELPDPDARPGRHSVRTTGDGYGAVDPAQARRWAAEAEWIRRDESDERSLLRRRVGWALLVLFLLADIIGVYLAVLGNFS